MEIELTRGLRDFTVELTLSVGPEVVALAGPSGAGKTTILRCVAGLDIPDHGSIHTDRTTWFDGASKVNLPPERRSVGYVPQNHALFPHLTVTQNVAFGGAARQEVTGLLERLRISHLAHERPERLSGGERQRVALARALARRPEVLLLDEPLAALDAHTRRIVREELADELHQLGLPTLLVTHDLRDATVLADRVAVIIDGRVRQLAPPAELTANPADAFVVELTGGFVLTGQGRGRVVALEHGAHAPVDRHVDGPRCIGLHPWDIEVQRGPGPENALRGIVGSLAIEGPRTRISAGGWSGDAPTRDGLQIGELVHGLIRRAHLLP